MVANVKKFNFTYIIVVPKFNKFSTRNIFLKTPSFLNVKIKLNNKSNLVEFNNRLKKIDLIDDFYVQQLTKDYVLVKIKYLGKINKIMNKLKDQKIDLKMIAGQWQLTII